MFRSLNCVRGSASIWRGKRPITYYLSIWGQDRLGFVQDVTHSIEKQQGNIGTSNMVTMNHYFSMIMEVKFSHTIASQKLSSQLNQQLNPKRMNVHIFPAHQRESSITTTDTYHLQSILPDQHGLIHSLSRILHNHYADITQLETITKTAPYSGQQLAHINGKLSLPIDHSIRNIEEDLTSFEEEYGGHVNLEKI